MSESTATPTTQTQHIGSVLVANRGEIARRVFATARSMGMRCIAVYVEADSAAPFVEDADESVLLSSTYLDGDAIIEAARVTGADAIHPGYGFLSENAAFAQSVTNAGLIWVGPTPEVIASMGDKITAKASAEAAEVPTLPSAVVTNGDLSGAEHVGYPLLVKASAGGGGKGMRVVNSATELDDAVAAAQREALSSFGDERVFLERYVAESRHIEIQILGDQHGNLVHLGERECSIQRRHQKIIEESPSSAIDEETRAAMGAAALQLGAALGYCSTGTVEFLVDEATKEFFFLEVNTRLQVEHPVTEAVTGIDLVREQLRVAGGSELGYGQADITISGHAIEARLYAEDPASDFLPQTGTLSAFEPAFTFDGKGPALRWDLGIKQGSVVGIDFDPMLGKVIAHAPTRSEAAGQLARGLERLHLGGLRTNRDFLSSTLRTAEFLSGDTTTSFIDRVDITRPQSPESVRFAAIAAALWLEAANVASNSVSPKVPGGWRNGRLPMEQTSLAFAGTAGDSDQDLVVRYRRTRSGSFVVGDSESIGGGVATVHASDAASIDLVIDGRRQRVRVTRATNHKIDNVFVQTPTTTLTFNLLPRFVVPGDDGPAGGLIAPMPGTVLDVRVSEGETVRAGQVLLVLEAMKMEHPITAPADGEIGQVRVTVGQQVELDYVLMVMADGAGDSDADTGDAGDSARTTTNGQGEQDV